MRPATASRAIRWTRPWPSWRRCWAASPSNGWSSPAISSSPCALVPEPRQISPGWWDWLKARRVRLVLLKGNHDRSVGVRTSLQARRRPWPRPGGESAGGLRLDDRTWSLPVSARCLITGHHHPGLRVSGRTAPCFLAGPNRIILPAFSSNAAGLDIGERTFSAFLAWALPPMLCQHRECRAGFWPPGDAREPVEDSRFANVNVAGTSLVPDPVSP